jgi:hypothetical protein
MLHEEDDPLSSSIFDIPSNSTNMLGNSMSASMFSSQYEEDPWGGSSTMERSFPSSNLNYSTTHTTSDAIGKPQVQLTASTVLGK